MTVSFDEIRVPFHHRILQFVLVATGLLAAAGGCLSFGGGTTHVHENPETTQQLVNLEARVQALENMLARPSTLPPSQAAVRGD